MHNNYYWFALTPVLILWINIFFSGLYEYSRYGFMDMLYDIIFLFWWRDKCNILIDAIEEGIIVIVGGGSCNNAVRRDIIDGKICICE